VRSDFLAPLTEARRGDPMEVFRRNADLARMLLHEKVHAHQAPEGGSLSEGVRSSDWTASADVRRECRGPQAHEVQAYYTFILALYRWQQRVLNQEPPEGASEEEQQAFMESRRAKAAWLEEQARHWLEVLSGHNYEKFSDASRRLEERIAEIDNNPDLTDAQKLQQKIELLEQELENMFADGSFYDRARDTYREKRGERRETGEVSPGAGTSLPVPGGSGSDSDDGWILVVSEEAVVEPGVVCIYEFAVPPDPDPGLVRLSPVYEMVTEL